MEDNNIYEGVVIVENRTSIFYTKTMQLLHATLVKPQKQILPYIDTNETDMLFKSTE